MSESEPASEGPDRRLLLVVLLGLLVVFFPLFVVPSGAGPVAFAVQVVQAIAALVGVVVAGAGLYSYRSGDPRPAVAAAATVIGLLAVGVVGAAIELTGGPLVPVWAWFLAALAVILSAFGLTLLYVEPDRP